jgi:mono/diheme cytochrome c family protein
MAHIDVVVQQVCGSSRWTVRCKVVLYLTPRLGWLLSPLRKRTAPPAFLGKRHAVIGIVRWQYLCAAVVVLAACQAPAGAAQSRSLVEQGGYLVNSILACGNCHSPRGASGEPINDSALSGGGISFTTPGFDATSSNITPDRETGIGSWTDADIKRALTQGVRPNHGRLAGAPLAAVMPISFFKTLLPRDLDAVIAYLRTVKPVRYDIPQPVYKVPVHHAPYPDAEKGFTEAMMNDPVRRGAYLVTIGHCMECHSPFEKGRSDYGKLGKGGREFSPREVHGLPSNWKGSVARNITSHRTAGIGAWSDAEIKRAITKGISRDGRKLQPPMAFAYYDRMTEADLNAVVAYLRTVTPQE